LVLCGKEKRSGRPRITAVSRHQTLLNRSASRQNRPL
jgi:hypothetical protein